MQQDRFQKLTSSARNALAWAFTRSLHRAPSKEVTHGPVSAADLLVGIFLAHPDDSEPYQLFEHFHLSLESFFVLLKADGGLAPDDPLSSSVSLDQMPPLDTEMWDQGDVVSLMTWWSWGILQDRG